MTIRELANHEQGKIVALYTELDTRGLGFGLGLEDQTLRQAIEEEELSIFSQVGTGDDTIYLCANDQGTCFLGAWHNGPWGVEVSGDNLPPSQPS